MVDYGPVSDNLNFGVDLQDSPQSGGWVSKAIPESVPEAIENAPIGSMYEIVYASLAARLRALLDQQSALGLMGSVIPAAVNFRSLNPNFFAGGVRSPTVQPDSGAGAGRYHASIWGNNKDERLPQTLPTPIHEVAYAPGQDPTPLQDKGLLIAKLFSDLQHHLPTVLFNITSKQYVPIGIGGSAVTKRFRKDGMTVTELGYRAIIGVEATAVAHDDQAAATLQAIIEVAFGTLRDQVGTGAAITGKSFQLILPTGISPAPVTEVEAPWSQGDDKGGKLGVAVVGLENITFEAFARVGRPVTALIGTPDTSETVSIGEGEGPLQLALGQPQRLVIENAPVTSELVVSQTRNVLAIRRPSSGSGYFEIIPRRTGEATLYLYDTGATAPILSTDVPSGQASEPLAQRKVVVTAC